MLDIVKSLFWYNAEEAALLAADDDSSLLRKHSQDVELSVGGAPARVRVAVVPNDGLARLPEPLPLILLVHGLGGRAAQWEFVLDQLAYYAHVVTLDLPGHGKSAYVPEWERMTSAVFVDVLQQVLRLPDLPPHRGVVVVGHSMGASLALRLAAALGPGPEGCVGVACLAPAVFSPDAAAKLRGQQSWVPWIPPPLFNVFRVLDRRGGVRSRSVRTFTSPATTDDATLRRQLGTNLRVGTHAWLRTVAGFALLGPEDVLGVKAPVLVVGAADDKVTPPERAEMLEGWLRAREPAAFVEGKTVHHAGHALIIERPQVVSGLLGDFFAAHVNPQLSLAWQLSYRASLTDKWSLKNEAKWRATLAVGAVVQGSAFRGLKTLRQGDAEHSPELLEAKYPDIVAVIDISREHPPYDPESFRRIKYHKFPTVSKIPPSREEVENFIELVRSIPLEDGQTIGVHCHYGFNRTGFLIASYMIERLGVSVPTAIKAFQTSRPTGIRHPHFLDELELRYDL